MSITTIGFSIQFPQDRMVLHLSSEDGHIQRYTWPSKRHCNAGYELHIILRGKCMVDVEKHQYELLSGQGILIAPGKYHKAHSLSGDFQRLSLSFMLSDGELSASLKQAAPQSVHILPSAVFLAACNRFILECNSRHPFTDILQQALLTEMIVELFRSLGLSEHTDSDHSLTDQAKRLQLIDNYFERNFTKKGGCSVLAQQLHLSTRQLNRVLRAHYGMGFQEKLIQAKMDQASMLLRTSNMHVQDIINFVGYNSATAFYKAFLAQFGVTPTQYRQQTNLNSPNSP